MDESLPLLDVEVSVPSVTKQVIDGLSKVEDAAGLAEKGISAVKKLVELVDTRLGKGALALLSKASRGAYLSGTLCKMAVLCAVPLDTDASTLLDHLNKAQTAQTQNIRRDTQARMNTERLPGAEVTGLFLKQAREASEHFKRSMIEKYKSEKTEEPDESFNLALRVVLSNLCIPYENKLATLPQSDLGKDFWEKSLPGALGFGERNGVVERIDFSDVTASFRQKIEEIQMQHGYQEYADAQRHFKQTDFYKSFEKNVCVLYASKEYTLLAKTFDDKGYVKDLEQAFNSVHASEGKLHEDLWKKINDPNHAERYLEVLAHMHTETLLVS